MRQQRVYETPLSEILCISAQDVVTASGFSEENTDYEEGKGGHGYGDKNHVHVGPWGQNKKSGS